MTTNPGMVPADVYRMRWAAEPRLSPDGQTVALVLWRVDEDSSRYHADIWLVPIDGSPGRQFTFDSKRNASPRWSPDGTRLAFVSDRHEDKGQIFVAATDGGEAKRLTKLDEEPSEISWSPDGRTILFACRVRDKAYAEEEDRKRAPRRTRRLQYKLDNVGWTLDRRQHIFTVSTDAGGEPTQLTSGDFEDGDPAWSPDGESIAFCSAREDDWDTTDASDLYVVEASGGQPRKLTSSQGICAAPAWSPDGTLIAFHYTPGELDAPHHTQVAVVEAAGGPMRLVSAALDRNCGPFPAVGRPVWDAQGVVFAVEDRGNTHLYRAPGDASRPPQAITSGEFGVTGYDVTHGAVVHTRSTPTRLPELFAGDHRLTRATEELAATVGFVEPERFTAVSADGAQVDAWIIRPVGYVDGERYPALLNIHGGPFTQYGTKFFDEFQTYAGAGYAVIFSNPRGSSGYSEEWGRAIRGPASGGPGMGTVDFDDLMAVTDAALQSFDFLDPERLGVMGGSYGGFMTSWIVAHTNRFKAACSERAVNDWHSFFGSSDFGWWFKSYVGAHIFEEPQSWQTMSPTAYATNIETPLLIIHSEEDLRCDVEQAEHLFTMLRLLKKDVEFVRFPAEGHELSRSGSPAHRVMRFEIILEWFDRYLKP